MLFPSRGAVCRARRRALPTTGWRWGLPGLPGLTGSVGAGLGTAWPGPRPPAGLSGHTGPAGRCGRAARGGCHAAIGADGRVLLTAASCISAIWRPGHSGSWYGRCLAVRSHDPGGRPAVLGRRRTPVPGRSGPMTLGPARSGPWRAATSLRIGRWRASLRRPDRYPADRASNADGTGPGSPAGASRWLVHVR